MGRHSSMLHSLLVMLGHQQLGLGQWGGGRWGGFRDGWGGGCLCEDTLLYLLLLLKCLHEGCLQPASVLSLQGLLLIGRHTLVTEDGPCLLFSPARGEVCLTLGTGVWLFGDGAGHGSSWTQITCMKKQRIYLSLDMFFDNLINYWSQNHKSSKVNPPLPCISKSFCTTSSKPNR